MGAFQDQRVVEITGIGPAKALRCVAVLTLGAKVGYGDWLVAVGTLRSRSLYSLVTILTPQFGVLSDYQIGVG
jgi:hypothetical protein